MDQGIPRDHVRLVSPLSLSAHTQKRKLTHASFWLTYAAIAFTNSIVWNLSAYVTSEFSEHSLIPTISIVSNVMSAVAYMVLAKVLNLWDRSYGYLAMTALSVLGLILSAACKDIYTYCAAQVRSQ